VEGKVKMLLGLGDTVQSLSALVGIAVGFLMMIPEVTLWIREDKLYHHCLSACLIWPRLAGFTEIKYDGKIYHSPD
jgi:hypothetical protein